MRVLENVVVDIDERRGSTEWEETIWFQAL